MNVVVVCSASGSPGASVTALGLALTWPRDVLLVDADRTPSQSILAGYLRGDVAQGRGLPGLLQAHRERRELIDALEEQAVPLPEPPARGRPAEGEKPVTRGFVPGFVRLGTIDLFNRVWRDLALTLAAVHPDVIVDAGRLGVAGLQPDLAEVADRVLLTCRSSLPSLAGVRMYLGPLAELVPDDRLGLLMIGPGRPYPAKEVAEQFGVPVAATIPWEPRGADDLANGNPLAPRWRGQRLASSYAEAGRALVSQADALRAGEPVVAGVDA